LRFRVRRGRRSGGTVALGVLEFAHVVWLSWRRFWCGVEMEEKNLIIYFIVILSR
jgi:hypothetical protein